MNRVGVAATVLAAVSLGACGSGPVEVVTRKETAFFASVTFAVAGIVPPVWRVDVTVNGREIQPLYGSFETAVTDRVTLTVPAGDSLNAFARGFEGDSVILYIGDTWFDVTDSSPQTVTINLKYKGPHAPTP